MCDSSDHQDILLNLQPEELVQKAGVIETGAAMHKQELQVFIMAF